MKDQVQQILERELLKLDAMSRLAPDGLALQDVRRLEVLIKCYSAFVGPLEAKPAQDAPANQSTDDLVRDVLSDLHK